MEEKTGADEELEEKEEEEETGEERLTCDDTLELGPNPCTIIRSAHRILRTSAQLAIWARNLVLSCARMVPKRTLSDWIETSSRAFSSVTSRGIVSTNGVAANMSTRTNTKDDPFWSGCTSQSGAKFVVEVELDVVEAAKEEEVDANETALKESKS